MTPTPANEGRLPKRLEPGESFEPREYRCGQTRWHKPELQFLGAWDGRELRSYRIAEPPSSVAELIAQRAAKKKGG